MPLGTVVMRYSLVCTARRVVHFDEYLENLQLKMKGSNNTNVAAMLLKEQDPGRSQAGTTLTIPLCDPMNKCLLAAA